MSKKLLNYCFIDWQNLHLGVSEDWWKIDYLKLRRYLKEKYKVSKAYYFLGYVQDKNLWLYSGLQEAGFIVVFKKQLLEMKSNKKGNIDSDLIFRVMEKLIEEKDDFSKIVLISGDGDFKILVDYLIKKDRFKKIIFPSRKFSSSLYKNLSNKFYYYLINKRKKIEYKKKKT